MGFVAMYFDICVITASSGSILILEYKQQEPTSRIYA